MVYHEVKFKLKHSQKQKINEAYKSGRSVKLRLSNINIHPSGTPIKLTESEIARLSDGRVHDVTISHSRLQKMGGILPLIPILAGLATAAGISGGVAGTVSGIKQSRAADEQRKAAEATAALAQYELEQRKKKGGILPLIPLIAGLAAAGLGGGAAATAAIKSKSKHGTGLRRNKKGGFLPIIPALAALSASKYILPALTKHIKS